MANLKINQRLAAITMNFEGTYTLWIIKRNKYLKIVKI